jgi:hypothetical protein
MAASTKFVPALPHHFLEFDFQGNQDTFQEQIKNSVAFRTSIINLSFFFLYSQT